MKGLQAGGSRLVGTPALRGGDPAALVALLVPVYVLIAPVTSWREPLVLAMLAAMAVVVDRHDVQLPAGIRFDALMAVAFIAVAVGGPLPAFAVVLVPMVFNAATGHGRVFRSGNLANLAAYGWYTLAGGLILQATAPDPIAAAAIGSLILATLVRPYVNWAVGPAIYGPLWLGRPFRAFVDLLLRRDAPFRRGHDRDRRGLWGPVHRSARRPVVALALFAVIAVLPGSFLTYAARARPAAPLRCAPAPSRYAHALAVKLGLGRAERRRIVEVADAARRRPREPGGPVDYVVADSRRLGHANYEAQLLAEWWNGRGGPIGLRGEGIPLAARVIAVADAWSALTTAGTPQIKATEEALAHLDSAAGAGLDPAVVGAARAVVAQNASPRPSRRLSRACTCCGFRNRRYGARLAAG